MEIKEAIVILMQMVDKDFLSSEEKEAIKTAIGNLDWIKHGQDRAKRIMKNKRKIR